MRGDAAFWNRIRKQVNHHSRYPCASIGGKGCFVCGAATTVTGCILTGYDNRVWLFAYVEAREAARAGRDG